SYSDLMTSLFFVMLVLFVLVIVLLHNKINQQAEELENYKTVPIEKYKYLEQAEQALKNIDQNYFEYDSLYKRHTLKNITVSFRTGSSNIDDIPKEDLESLYLVGRSINDFMKQAVDSIPDVKYLLIVEGQSSKDNYSKNYELSYARALSLVNYWTREGIYFNNNYCEVIISGSGQASPFREKPDIAGNKANQRFVIHIIPKTGIVEK
ncbi:OmpA family protein, partial [Bacteroidales bacterium OttesenSCG-928-L03]|nr:OmpA family protein [Bacteroidales bacterium OttesenSCG-928-L03]